MRALTPVRVPSAGGQRLPIPAKGDRPGKRHDHACERGGHWRFVEHTDGGPQGSRADLRKVTQPERLVMTFEWDSTPGHVVVESMTLEDLGDGRTRVVTVALFIRQKSATAWCSREWSAGSMRATRRWTGCWRTRRSAGRSGRCAGGAAPKAHVSGSGLRPL